MEFKVTLSNNGEKKIVIVVASDSGVAGRKARREANKGLKKKDSKWLISDCKQNI